MKKRSVTVRQNHPIEQSAGRGGGIAAMLSELGPVVYAIRTRDGLLKIGYTSNFGNRHQQLGPAQNILAWKAGTRADEFAIHFRLRGHAVRGREWYSPTDSDVIAVVDEMRAKMGLSPL